MSHPGHWFQASDFPTTTTSMTAQEFLLSQTDSISSPERPPMSKPKPAHLFVDDRYALDECTSYIHGMKCGQAEADHPKPDDVMHARLLSHEHLGKGVTATTNRGTVSGTLTAVSHEAETVDEYTGGSSRPEVLTLRTAVRIQLHRLTEVTLDPDDVVVIDD